ncbi:MAG: 50S ribosomal protein L6 [Candidatus Nealsonbacteria bacterium CG_4_10_14_0_2_um_filter_40_15]|uniref:Large ribosomal subunit protein uL6 n=2 Tax=Candidatus Nealsoniibacteriota TaxID=1817911 RepID=A0A2M7D8B3_9BACT|nr:MAG: 50S ribosomal protein L6 [Candidatus Nealsonbacteria bacterium CG02_land_8_20_14_3_00_40_11]PIZ87394.1 MAG: 50S ribosomal protein L6 [Candidatus Nealsonbacteria bacterium CG_4_10_14_0_2_um_filter_40_15]
MSRVGKKIILIPDGVEVKIEGDTVKVKGPKGEISQKIRPEIKILIEDKKIQVMIQKQKVSLRMPKLTKSLWGLTRALIYNMVEGAKNGFEKKLEIQGVGYKAQAEGENLTLNVGFSHSVVLKVPEGIKVAVEKNIITISGINKTAIGQFAAIIRKVKPPEPYKGKGIRYLGEKVRRKVGKKVVTTAG